MRSHVNSVIQAAVEFSNRVRSDRKDRLLLNKILMDIGQIVGDREGIPSLKTWIETCPSIIRDKANIELLDSINRVMGRNPTCLDNGRREVAHLLANVDRLGNNLEHWKAVYNFIYLTSKDVGLEDGVVSSLTHHIERTEDPVIKAYGMGILSIVEAKI